MKNVYKKFKDFFIRHYSLHSTMCIIMMWASPGMVFIVSGYLELYLLAMVAFAIAGLRLYTCKNGSIMMLFHKESTEENQRKKPLDPSEQKYRQAVLNWAVIGYVIGWILFLTGTVLEIIRLIKQ